MKQSPLFFFIWKAVLIITTIFTAIELPVRLALGYHLEGFILGIDILICIIFVLDIGVSFIEPVKEKRKMIYDKKILAGKYIRSSWFILDLLAAVPFYYMAGSTAGVTSVFLILQLLRILKLLKVNKTLLKWQQTMVTNPSILRLILFLFWILLAAHWMACGWIGIRGDTMPFTDKSAVYTHSIYWCITTLTTVGYGDITPQNNLERIYTMMVMILGVGIYGYVIGNISSLLANIDVAKAGFLKKMEDISSFLNYKNVPLRLQEKVRNYYNYLWESKMGQNEKSMLADLPESLRTELSMSINRQIIEKVPFFKNADEKFIKDIVLLLTPLVLLPGDTVVKKGDIGDCMYFISQGSVNVLDDDEKSVLITLTEGSYFGEMALLKSSPRNKTIKTADYCNLYKLTKENFDKLLQDYPAFARDIQETIKQRE
ncbi:MAG TPA: ion transporter [Spirochaetota bacterium]|nr:ion transporter [Spirochaetota bacterium]